MRKIVIEDDKGYLKLDSDFGDAYDFIEKIVLAMKAAGYEDETIETAFRYVALEYFDSSDLFEVEDEDEDEDYEDEDEDEDEDRNNIDKGILEKFVNIKNNKKSCSGCGINWGDGTWGYVCPNLYCPSGCGPTSCSTSSGNVTLKYNDSGCGGNCNCQS